MEYQEGTNYHSEKTSLEHKWACRTFVVCNSTWYLVKACICVMILHTL